MTPFATGPSSPAGSVHPAVVDRRVRALALIMLAALGATAISLAIAIAVPHPNLLRTLAVIIGVIGLLVCRATLQGCRPLR